MQTLSYSFAVVLILILATHDAFALPRPCYLLGHLTPTPQDTTTTTSTTTPSTIEQLENIHKDIVKLITLERTSDIQSKISASETSHAQSSSPKTYTSIPNPFEELISNYVKFMSNLFTL
ncbi:unnamed protein product [Arctia plantaginis]|uniref:Uncharacterized protein n=1 Tax=Arctia plantaginis TaxID=874455 RepID=A0A8S1AE94_ARCPL|nr:unnamed protein product [Arctia plantaginis]